MAEQHHETALKRGLKWIYVYAIATGAIFTFVGYWDTIFIAYCGPGTFLAFALMTIAVMPIAFVYCELVPMFPQAGAELIYNTVGINKTAGFFSSWMILLAYINVPPAAVMAILAWVFRVFGVSMSIRGIMFWGIVVLCIYCILSLWDIQLAGKIQLAMLIMAILACLITTFALLFSGHWSWSNFTPFFRSSIGDGGIGGWVIGLGLIITPYFGFETVPLLIEEGDFPIKDSTKAIWSSVVTCGVIYSLLFFAVAGIAPYDTLLTAPDGSEVSFLTMTAMENLLGWKVWSVIYGFGAIIGAIGTCLLGFWLSTVRMIYAMGMQNFLPKSFAYCNKHQQPILPNLLLLGICIIFLLMMNTTTFIYDFFNLMAFGCAVAYAMTSWSAISIKIKHPNWQSPYHLAGGMFMRVLSLVLSIVIAVFCTIGQGIGSWKGFAVYIAIGGVLWLWMIGIRWRKEKVHIITPDGEMDF